MQQSIRETGYSIGENKIEVLIALARFLSKFHMMNI